MKSPKKCPTCGVVVIPLEDGSEQPIWSTPCGEHRKPEECTAGKLNANWVNVKSLVCKPYCKGRDCINPLMGSKFENLPEGDTWEKRAEFAKGFETNNMDGLSFQ